jgi:hypothetical protein
MMVTLIITMSLNYIVWINFYHLLKIVTL